MDSIAIIQIALLTTLTVSIAVLSFSVVLLIRSSMRVLGKTEKILDDMSIVSSRVASVAKPKNSSMLNYGGILVSFLLKNFFSGDSKNGNKSKKG